MHTTSDYPTTLHNTLTAIRDGLPRVDEQVSIERELTDQERVSGTMAEQLESLAEHYDKMENACKEHEHGEAFVEEDLLGNSFLLLALTYKLTAFRNEPRHRRATRNNF